MELLSFSCWVVDFISGVKRTGSRVGLRRILGGRIYAEMNATTIYIHVIIQSKETLRRAHSVGISANQAMTRHQVAVKSNASLSVLTNPSGADPNSFGANTTQLAIEEAFTAACPYSALPGPFPC